MSHFQDTVDGINKGQTTATKEEIKHLIEQQNRQFQDEIEKFANKMEHFLSPDQILIPTITPGGTDVRFEVIDMSTIDPTKPLISQEFEKVDGKNVPKATQQYVSLKGSGAVNMTAETLADQVATFYAKGIDINTASPVEEQMQEHIKNWDNFDPKIKEDILNKLDVKSRYDQERSDKQNTNLRQRQAETSAKIEGIKDAVRLPKTQVSRDEVRADIFQQLEANPDYNALSPYTRGKIVNDLETKYNASKTAGQSVKERTDATAQEKVERLEKEKQARIEASKALSRAKAAARVQVNPEREARRKQDAKDLADRANKKLKREKALMREDFTREQKQSAQDYARKIISTEANSPIVLDKNPRYKELQDKYLDRLSAVKANVLSQLQPKAA